jgi:hypothetical protein
VRRLTHPHSCLVTEGFAMPSMGLHARELIPDLILVCSLGMSNICAALVQA